MGRPQTKVQVRQKREADWFIRPATAGAVGYTVTLPLVQVYRISSAPVDQQRAGWALALTLVCLPVQVWLVWSAAGGAWGRRQRWVLGAMAALVLAMVPVAGVDGLGTIYVLAGLMLVVMPLRWSLPVFMALVVTPIPVALQAGQPQWASYFTLGVLLGGVPLAVVVWLVRAARQLQAARLTLAQQAVVRERLRIDGELRQTVGAALESIAAQGDRAAALAAGDPSAAARQLDGLAGTARRTLAEARRMVSHYQQATLRGEVEAAVSLLAAAGIKTRLVIPPGDLPDHLDQAARASLRRDLVGFLDRESDRSVVTITVAHHTHGVQVELRCDRTDPAATG